MWDGGAGGIPQPHLVSATVERGLSFLWFNWARNHFRCNTRADAAAMSSNHRKSSTSLPPTVSLSLSLSLARARFILPSSTYPTTVSFQPLLSRWIEETTELPIIACTIAVEYASVDFVHSDRWCVRDAFRVIKTVARLHKGRHHIPLLHSALYLLQRSSWKCINSVWF